MSSPYTPLSLLSFVYSPTIVSLLLCEYSTTTSLLCYQNFTNPLLILYEKFTDISLLMYLFITLLLYDLTTLLIYCLTTLLPYCFTSQARSVPCTRCSTATPTGHSPTTSSRGVYARCSNSVLQLDSTLLLLYYYFTTSSRHDEFARVIRNVYASCWQLL